MSLHPPLDPLESCRHHQQLPPPRAYSSPKASAMMEKAVSAAAAVAVAAVSTVLVAQNSHGSAAEGRIPRVEDIQRPLGTIAFGSCNDQSFPQPLWKNIAAHEPDLWLWMGDNIYADIKELDEPTKVTFPPQKMFKEASPDVLLTRYGKLVANEDYAAFVNHTPVIGIWDDHDFGINDGYKDYTYRVQSQQIFLDFMNEPEDSPRRKQEGIYTSYTVGSDDQTVKFILLDNRYNRDPYGTKNGNLLGEAQWQWFEQELLTSTAAFNVIVSGVQILPADRFAIAECWDRFPHERERLLRLILKSHAKGVILLSGDVHFSELNQVVCSNGATTLTEVTSSGMTHSWMQFHRPSLQTYMALLFTYANLLMPWEFRPTQDAFYGYLNWGSIEFDWENKPHPVATVSVRGRDDAVKLQHKYESVSHHSETPEEDAAACVAPRAVEPWRRWLWRGLFIATAALFLLSLPACAIIGLWLVWYFISRVVAAVLGGGKPKEKADDASSGKKKN